MSFSVDVKNELSWQISSARHCNLAELAALIGMCGSICISSFGKYSIRIRTENVTVARKCFTLLQKAFNIESGVCRLRISFWCRNPAVGELLFGEHF